MKKNLFDFGDEKLSEDYLKDQAENLDENTKKQAEDYYEKYKNYSKDELMQEFLNQTKNNIARGSFSKEKFESTISSLMPFLNEEQKNFLNYLKGQIDDIK